MKQGRLAHKSSLESAQREKRTSDFEKVLISYPESSGFLVTEQPIKKIEFFRCPQSLPG